MNNRCCECNSPDLIIADHMLVCMSCGTVNEMKFYVNDYYINFESIERNNTYKCINYFKRIIRCLQDKSNTNIKEDIIDLIKLEYNKNNLSTYETLKKHKLFGYYIHIPQINRMLYNVKPIIINPNDEIKLYSLFYDILKVVRKKFPNRSHCVRYKPVLKKLFHIINRDDIAHMIPDIKTKRAKDDFNNIWNAVISDKTISYNFKYI